MGIGGGAVLRRRRPLSIGSQSPRRGACGRTRVLPPVPQLTPAASGSTSWTNCDSSVTHGDWRYSDKSASKAVARCRQRPEEVRAVYPTACLPTVHDWSRSPERSQMEASSAVSIASRRTWEAPTPPGRFRPPGGLREHAPGRAGWDRGGRVLFLPHPGQGAGRYRCDCGPGRRAGCGPQADLCFPRPDESDVRMPAVKRQVREAHPREVPAVRSVRISWTRTHDRAEAVVAYAPRPHRRPSPRPLFGIAVRPSH